MKHIIHVLFLTITINDIITLCSKLKENYNTLSTNDFSVRKVLKRPETYYTQGIFFNDDGNSLYESGGLYGKSVIVKMEYPQLGIVKNVNLDSIYFAEGIAKCGDFIYQLTWRERKILKYSVSDLKLNDTIELDFVINEGWGLSSTNTPNELIASDGSSSIYFLDCVNNLQVTRKISVTNNNKPISYINALSFAEDYIWANRYFTNTIYKINPSSGEVVKSYDMTNLINFELDQKTLTNTRLNSGDVLNGIAYNKANKFFLLTGKKWGHYYEVEFK